MNLTTRFVDSFSLTDDLLTQIIQDKQTISLSLRQLSKLHHLQKMLEEFQFLNIVYSDQSRVRKMMLTRTKSNLNLQQQLCHQIDKKIEDFMNFFKKLDSILFYTMNMQLMSENCLEFLQQIADLILGSPAFTVIYEINKKVNGMSTHIKDIENAYQKLLKFKESTNVQGSELDNLFGTNELYVYKNKYSYLIYDVKDVPFKAFPDYRLILDQFISIAYDFQKEIYDKENLVSIIRGIKSRFIKNSTRICQEVIRQQVTEVLSSQCWIEMPDQIQYMNDLIIDQHGYVVLPVKLDKQIKYYIKIESPNIDMITFSDYIQQLWQRLTYQLKDLKNEEFLKQMLEVNSPNKLYIQLDGDGNIRYQSCCIPDSWYFMLIKGGSLEDLQLEQVNKQSLIQKMQELKSSVKGAVSVCQICFGDKAVDVDLFAKRNEEDEITDYYIVFNAPKKKFEDDHRISSQMSSESKLQELSKAALINIKMEKLSKACNVMRDYLKVNLTDEEIIDLLKEKDILKEVYNQQSITDDIRSSYVMEYYKAESSKVMRDPVQGSQQYIIESELTNIKKFDLYTLDANDISNLSDYSFDITVVQDKNEQLRYTWALFHLCNFIDLYQINKEVFYQFTVIVQEKYSYRQNPFHNFDHGFTVAHACYYIIKSKSMNQYFDKFIQFTALLSALCHDIDHTGRNNHFESQKLSKLALRYNDESVLENHHASVMFKILQKEKYNILSSLSQDQFSIFRKYAIANILGTDMKKHFEIVKLLELKLSKLPDEPFIQKEEDKKFLSSAIIHTCDLTMQSKTFKMAQKWSNRIATEFSDQVAEEKQLSLPITQHFLPLGTPNFNQLLAKQEISFIKFIVKPAYDLTAQVLQTGLEVPLKNLEDNLKEWENQK
ncbi:unnamed protein product [Paramecium octaurelia]|uniref:Phosphodiesterase n=1 Tax=Paramecium octaurelia TaxID=43137 RepID=A0A8S1W143_PAROT|nr:unnamed protein product [Paramecium octaurelia]